MLQPDGTAAPVGCHSVPDDLFVQPELSWVHLARHFSHLSSKRP